jgi:hypothetical protein
MNTDYPDKNIQKFLVDRRASVFIGEEEFAEVCRALRFHF